MSLLILSGMAAEWVHGSQASGKVGKGHWEQLKQLERELKPLSLAEQRISKEQQKKPAQRCGL